MKIKIIFLSFFILFNHMCAKNNLLHKEYKKIESKFVAINNKVQKKEKFTQNPSSNTGLNWSGYVAATDLNNPKKNSVKGIFGSWQIPTLNSKNNSSCTIWIGIDGFATPTIEQIGTSHQIINGTQINFAWFAMNPNSAYRIANFPVNVNDSISASVIFIGNNKFLLTIINNTTLQFTTIPLILSEFANTLRSTAQWIVESNESSFAKFNEIEFNNCQAIINNIKGNINNESWQSKMLTMVLGTNVLSNKNNFNKNTARALPSELNSSGNSFKVNWLHE